MENDPSAFDNTWIVRMLDEEESVYEVGNMTSNVQGMWDKALGGMNFQELNGKRAGEYVDLLVQAVEHIYAPENQAEYEAMNPENGWGSHAGAAEYLLKLLQGCRAYPDAVIEMSY